MNRVEAAIQDGRCVLVIGGRALQNAAVLSELRRRPLPSVALGAEVVNPTVALSELALAPALAQEGGVIVLVEPEPATDGRTLEELGRLIAASKHKPRLCIAAKAFNPFALPLTMRLLKMEQIKSRAQDFLGSLPVDAPQVVLVEATRAAVVAAVAPNDVDEKKARAPRPTLVGRDEELAALRELLGSAGGPIVVSGAPGSGRHWLVESALEGAGLSRLPDLVFGRGTGADTLLARIAMTGRLAGDTRLHDALRMTDDRPTPAALATLAAETLQGEGLTGKVWVLHGLDELLDHALAP